MDFVEPIRKRENIEIVKQILKENGTRDFLLFLLGINVGLRISDILKLKVKDVKNKEYFCIKEQKTGKFKKIPITTSFGKELQEFVKYKNNNEWLFKSNRGNKAISRIQAYRIINSACRKAGIESNWHTHIKKNFWVSFLQEKQRYRTLAKNTQSFFS